VNDAAGKTFFDRCRDLVKQVYHFFTGTTLGTVLLKYGIGLGLLTYVVIANWSGLADAAKRKIHFGPLLLAAAVTAVGLLITFVRWYILVRAVDLPFTVYNAIRFGLIGYYFSMFLPSSVGGDVLKAYSIAREQNRRTRAVATVLIDRAIGLWALVWFVAIIGTVFWLLNDPLLQNAGLRRIILYSMFVAVGSTLAWIVVGLLPADRAERFAQRLHSIPKLGGSLAEFWRACFLYTQKSRAVLIAMLMSMVGHTCWVLVFHLSVQAFETPNPEVDIGTFPEHMIVVPVGMVVQALFPSPGGIGGGEAAFGWLYTLLGKPEVNGIIGCFSQRIVFWCMGLIGYIVYTRMRAGIGKIEPIVEAEAKAAGPEPPPPPIAQPEALQK
jgi:uncharacterized protein (TIRG00374 family)